MIWAFLAAGLFMLLLWGSRRVNLKVGPRSARPSRKSAYLLLAAGSSWSLVPVKSDGVYLENDGAQYPINACHYVSVPSGFGELYVFVADGLQLAEYQKFSELMPSVIKGALFKPAGDFAHTMQLIGASLVIAAAVYTYTQVSSLTSVLVQQQSSINAIVEVISKPLEVKK